MAIYLITTATEKGEVVPALKSTAVLSVEEFSNLILQTEILAAKEGVIINHDEDYYTAIGIKDKPSGHVQQPVYQQLNDREQPAAAS